MFTDWLRHLRQDSLCQPQRIRKPRRGRGSAGVSTAVVQTLEPRVLLANPAGAEFQVNTTTVSFQRTNVSASSVALDADGDFVVTWSSFGQDGSGYGIFAQRYNAAGAAQGGEFQVNTYTTNSQQQSAVAMDADGDFVIAWSSGSQDGSGYGIYG
ncbi:MAG TPA: hypothetical protein VM165_03110, partial [Planctomycetaceae bacterium]|nr:hypothetical protein [Planctomycetaceae bacterium]